MIVEKMMMAIASEKTRKPSSLAQLCSVLPRMRSPAEWRENLKILHESRYIARLLKTQGPQGLLYCAYSDDVAAVGAVGAI